MPYLSGSAFGELSSQKLTLHKTLCDSVVDLTIICSTERVPWTSDKLRLVLYQIYFCRAPLCLSSYRRQPLGLDLVQSQDELLNQLRNLPSGRWLPVRCILSSIFFIRNLASASPFFQPDNISNIFVCFKVRREIDPKRPTIESSASARSPRASKQSAGTRFSRCYILVAVTM